MLRSVSEENVAAGWSPCVGRGLHVVPTGSANSSFPRDALGGFSACRGRRLISTIEV